MRHQPLFDSSLRSDLKSTLLRASLIVVSMAVSAYGQSSGIDKGEWPSYAGDLHNYHYSPGDQINGSNFNDLEVAWRLKTDNLGSHPEYKYESTPLMVKGIIYATAGSRRDVVALDATTGELLWVHGEHEGERAAASPRQLSGRGLSYWSDGKIERIIYVTQGYRLVVLDAKTGDRVPSFGEDGVVDLKKSAVYGSGQAIDLVTGEIGLHATPAVTRSGIILVGSAFREGGTPKTHNNTKGMVTAWDIHTGKKLWQFNTIPRPGEFGNDTWLNNSWAINGNTGVWSQIAVDEDLGLAYLPVEDPTMDFYGGHRPGNNLYGDSIVCVDLKTGQRKWYFQLVHHPLWDMDIAAAPILADITVDGKPVKAVLVASKQAFMYVFDRTTGKPVWPIEERPVPKGDTPGEWYSPTQPFPTKPPAFDVQGVTEDTIIDFTPQLHAEALQQLAKFKMSPLFTPAVVSNINGPLASFRSSGGMNWPGFSFDPETHIAYVPSFISFPAVALLPPPNKDFSDLDYVEGFANTGVRYVAGPGENAGADARPQAAAETAAPAVPRGGPPTPEGLPLLKPPYGRITAINMDKGEFVWQIAHGDTPDNIRNNPALKGLNIPRTGQAGYVGVLVTKTLVIAGDPQYTATSDHPRGAMLHAYDKATGKELGRVYMPAPVSGTPMSYTLNGKQYIVVPISGGNYAGELLAFRLPDHQ
jgi:quinoprotein glucose dehydrogenase